MDIVLYNLEGWGGDISSEGWGGGRSESWGGLKSEGFGGHVEGHTD